MSEASVIAPTAHERLLEGLKNIVQVSPEDLSSPLGKDLLALAKEHDVTLLAFIAPEVPLKSRLLARQELQSASSRSLGCSVP